jgi:hypothetical protein
VTLIRQAQHEGIQNNAITDFQRYVLQDAADPYVHAELAGLRFGRTVLDDLFVKPFVSLDRDIRKFHEDPSFETLGTVLEDVATVLGIVALVVGTILPGTDVIAAPLLLGLSGAALASHATALATHEQGASWAQVGTDAFTLGIAGTGAVLGRGVTESERLATGTDAQDSADTLWNEGTQHLFSWTDIKGSASETVAEMHDWPNTLDAVPGTLLDDGQGFLRFGDDGSTSSPAALVFQHVQFGLDRLNDAITVLQDQSEQKGQPA